MYLFRHLRFPLLWTVLIIALVIVVLVNTSVYFRADFRPAFLLEKLPVSETKWWRTAFYFHIIGACASLVSGSLLFIPGLLRLRKLHFVLGYIYLNAVLWFAAPAGILISPTAKGGLAGATGFLVIGMAWWWTTWSGYLAIRRREIRRHIEWMVRSFSIALSAIFFRVFHVGFDLLGVDPSINYVGSIWLSLLASIWMAESWIIRRQTVSIARAISVPMDAQSFHLKFRSLS